MAQEHVLISDNGTRIPVSDDAFFKASKTLVNAVSHATDEADETLVPFKTDELNAAFKVFAERAEAKTRTSSRRTNY
jgi:hypothetical protein